MNISEKLIESCNTINIAIFTILISLSATSLYLVQRTINFIDAVLNAGINYAYRETQQSSVDLGVIELKFYFWFLDIAWIWILTGFVLIALALLRKRNHIVAKLIEDNANLKKADISALLPFDFLGRKFFYEYIALLVIPPLLVAYAAIFMIIKVVVLYYDYEWYFHSASTLIGCIACLLVTTKLVLEAKKGVY